VTNRTFTHLGCNANQFHCIFLLIAFILLLVAQPLAADDISNTDKYAWSENAGWVDFNATHSQVTVYDDHLEGYIWGEAVGWIRVGTYTVGDAHTYSNDAANTYGVNNDGSGNLSGYGWGENIGWVNFNSTHSQVTIDPTTGDFDGYAWSESVGWIHFQNAAPAYKVKRIIPDTTPDSFSFNAQNGVALSTLLTSNTITVSGINVSTAISISNGEYEINGSGSWVTTNGSISNSDTVKVRHTSSMLTCDKVCPVTFKVAEKEPELALWLEVVGPLYGAASVIELNVPLIPPMVNIVEIPAL